jgi:hypothetical protein
MDFDNVSRLLHKIFATDVGWHALQQSDGTYRKTYGGASLALLKKVLIEKKAVALYQKNIDRTLKWICYDFDIIKAYLEKSSFQEGRAELVNTVRSFCAGLEDLEIPYLLEFSGNRGYHVWITFSENIPYQMGYEIQQTLLAKIDTKFNQNIIAIDFFPSSSMATDGVGVGVKIPLSKHAKSNRYAHLIDSLTKIEDTPEIADITQEFVDLQALVLSSHKSASKNELETKLDVFFDIAPEDQVAHVRIKAVHTTGEFTLQDLLSLWMKSPTMQILASRISEKEKLNNEERKLLVGILGNLRSGVNEDFGKEMLLQIFKQHSSYNEKISRKAISKMASFAFPSQDQIEKLAGIKFSSKYELDDLLKEVIPNYFRYDDATFEMTRRDVETVRVAELNYLFMNDEAHSKLIVDELSSVQTESKIVKIEELIADPSRAEFYVHERIEPDRKRTLMTMKATERIFTTFFLKQLVYFFDFSANENSYGYQVNKGFKGGYIFEPWLYLWIRFVSNISEAIENPALANFYIVKTDISGFYDSIPHDNLKRLLLGGVNNRIDKRLSTLTKSNTELYRKYLDVVFAITQKMVGSKRGVPQGPAYARYFAELYLDTIDQKFDEKITRSKVVAYQRYVDDIFFICQSEADAKHTLRELSEDLKVMGLSLNQSKTKLTRIVNFVSDFDEYRSQSKYSVDRASRNFADATESQQNVAIGEFTNLLLSDSCDDDLAFVFSHLSGVVDLDNWKRDKFVSVINSSIGRGTLFKHMFNFALENQDNWPSLVSVDSYNTLQSEVLTATIIEHLEEGKQNHSDLLKLVSDLYDKLAITELVQEHFAYLRVVFDAAIPLNLISPGAILECIKKVRDVEGMCVSEELLLYINTDLNDIKSLVEFVDVLYPLCVSRGTSPSVLNDLASVFYAKVGSDQRATHLAINSNPPLNTGACALKFYYLVCLFSISNKNDSIELLQAIWQYCIHVVNFNNNDSDYSTPNWYAKISQIDMNQEKAMLIVSSIVDGSIVRGIQDNKNVFESFHNVFLLFMAFEDSALYSERVNEGLEELRKHGKFYEWLIDREHVRLFPNLGRAWFERNLVDNGVIILRRNNEILFRKPSKDFSASTRAVNPHNGYSEAIVEYFPNQYSSLRDLIGELGTHERLAALIKIIGYCDSDIYPNIFCSERILHPETLRPFHCELSNSTALIFEDYDGNVTTHINNRNNFVLCFFNAFSANDDFKMFKEKYLDNLGDTDLIEFIQVFVAQLIQIDSADKPMFYDFAFAAALWVSLSSLAPIGRIEKFVEVYHGFNENFEDRHIYGVKDSSSFGDSNPIELLKCVQASLALIVQESVPSIGVYLDKDVEAYRLLIEKIAANIEVISTPVNLEDFQPCEPRVVGDGKSLRIGQSIYAFKDVYIFNLQDSEVKVFNTLNRNIVSASHVYFKVLDGYAFLVSIEIAISKIYFSLRDRFAALISAKNQVTSYFLHSFNSQGIKGLPNFNIAVNVVSAHRGITISHADSLVVDWLRYIPPVFHDNLINLLAAHRVMGDHEISEFLKCVKDLLLKNGSHPFLIKRISDYNGTHRLLYRDNKLARSVDEFSPVFIPEGATKATIIVDNIISGNQIINAIRYYASGTGAKPNSNYFVLTQNELKTLKSRLGGIRELDICTVLYTSVGLANILKECKKYLHSDAVVNVVCGKDMGKQAFFGSTDRIGERDKDSIRAMLLDSSKMASLSAHLQNPVKSFMNIKSNEAISSINVVARYQSLPKKCFEFLHFGLMHDADTYPLTRVLEKNE